MDTDTPTCHILEFSSIILFEASAFSFSFGDSAPFIKDLGDELHQMHAAVDIGGGNIVQSPFIIISSTK
jgi:hypothetical protein